MNFLYFYRVSIVLIHVLSAFIWLGGMFFIALVAVPILRKIEPPAKRNEILSITAKRFRFVSWIAISVLLVTGLLNAINHGVTIDLISTGALFSSYFGKVLTVKVTLVFIMVVLSAIHDFFLGPQLTDLMSSGLSNPDSLESLKRRRQYVSWLARANVILGILVVACAVMLS
jgi:putative copper resistance protein D